MKIDKNIPIPKCGSGPKSAYPLGKMDVGDSFFIDKVERIKAANACQFVRKQTGRKFTVRKFEGGYRVWRVS